MLGSPSVGSSISDNHCYMREPGALVIPCQNTGRDTASRQDRNVTVESMQLHEVLQDHACDI